METCQISKLVSYTFASLVNFLSQAETIISKVFWRLNLPKLRLLAGIISYATLGGT